MLVEDLHLEFVERQSRRPIFLAFVGLVLRIGMRLVFLRDQFGRVLVHGPLDAVFIQKLAVDVLQLLVAENMVLLDSEGLLIVVF